MRTLHTRLRPKRVFAVGLYRLDVRTNGGPFIPHSFHESFDDAFDRGLRKFGIVEGEALPPGSDFIVRGPIEE